MPWFVTYAAMVAVLMLLTLGDAIGGVALHVVRGAAVGVAYCIGLYDARRHAAGVARRG